MNRLGPAARSARVLLALLAVFASAATAGPSRVVAVGDVHGDREGLVRILQAAGLADDEGRWAGGDAVLVQTGDLVDRGPDVRGVLDYMMRLEEEAAQAGGRVEVLLGNHEVMNLMGDLRYVTTENFAQFADDRSERRRRDAWRDQERYLRQRGGGGSVSEGTEAAWMEAHPPGFVEQREAMAPDGRYGRWLRQRRFLVTVAGTLFVHGGLSPALPDWTVEQIDEQARTEVTNFDRARQILVDRGLAPPLPLLTEVLDAAVAESARAVAAEDPPLAAALDVLDRFGSWITVHTDGPLWFRGFDSWTVEEGTPAVEALAARFGVMRFVAGHSAQEGGRIGSRFDGRVYLIDTGLLANYSPGGRASALEVDGDRVTAIYEDGRAVLAGADAAAPLPAPDPEPQPGRTLNVPSGARLCEPHTWTDPAGAPLPFRNDEEVVAFLADARVVSERDVGEGVTLPKKLLLERDGVQVHAVFRYVDREETAVQMQRRGREMFFRDSYLFEPAAYELARLLEIPWVPPATLRKVAATPGSVQVWLEGAFTEGKRRERDQQPPDPAFYTRQMQIIAAFDSLIYNTDRNQGNFLIDADWRIWMIDHTRAFRRQREPWKSISVVQVDRLFLQRLRGLDEGLVRERLAPYLRGAEVEALLIRRQKLLKHVDDLIAREGADRVLFDFLVPCDDSSTAS